MSVKRNTSSLKGVGMVCQTDKQTPKPSFSGRGNVFQEQVDFSGISMFELDVKLMSDPIPITNEMRNGGGHKLVPGDSEFLDGTMYQFF